MDLVYILAGIIVLLFVIQILTVGKVVALSRQMDGLLFEIRILFKSNGVYYVSEKEEAVKTNNCQHCIYRMSFIQVAEDMQTDQFYYRCRIRNTEVTLSDTCKKFERDHSIAR
jgi:hypothetical protein